jgi:predicted CxxxxCH...CXXCH cytochrome family protein
MRPRGSGSVRLLIAVNNSSPSEGQTRRTEVIRKMRNFSIVSATVALAALTACATAENVEGVTGSSGCVSCHGGKDNQSGAPPFDLANATTTSAPTVGAHTTHIAQGVTCSACHVDPSKGPAPLHGTRGHGNAEVVFSSLADPSHLATYDRSAHTCANVYCHTQSGASLPTPTWNVPAGTITGCDACHQGPATIHGGVAVTLCATCHPTTVDATGAVKPPPGGTHVNGQPDAFTHDPDWMTTSGPHTIKHGVAANHGDPAWPGGFNDCRKCHGADLNSPIANTVPSCTACHTAQGFANWQTDCTFCHGNFGGGLQTDAAPPRDVLGNTAATSKHVGAHQAHLFGDATNTPQISNGVSCTDCHGGTSRTLPTSFDPHASGTLEVTPKQPGQNAQTGTYDPMTGTCSNVYCHGNFPRNPQPGNNPVWNVPGGQNTCGTCHAANGVYGASDAMTGLHAAHRCGNATCHGTSATSSFSKTVGCFACHVGVYQQQLGTTTITPPKVNLGIHVDGAVEVIGTTSGLYNNFALSLTYQGPVGSNPPNCTTNCHSIGTHAANNAPAGQANWQ